MAVAELVARPEHLTPHDLVTYSRCPYEMELVRAGRAALRTGAPESPRTPADVVPQRHSPLFTPPVHRLTVNEGRLDILPSDLLVYEDPGEDDMPVLFAPSQVRPDPRWSGHGGNFIDEELGFAGRPDFVVRRGASYFPVEYKSTHLFVGYHEAHGRAFDAIQAIAECRLVEATTGVRPTHGVILYGDVAGDGAREGWVEVPYGDAEAHWIRAALTQIRTDLVRPPVPAERNCASCHPNAEGKCRFAAARPDGSPHPGCHPSNGFRDHGSPFR